MRLQAGEVIADKLRLSRQLGAGGMGSVWIADHLTLKTQVAVKLMSAELAGSTEALARFSREAAAAARIRSPHAVKVFDYGVSDRTPYMVLELLEGEHLARLRRERALEPLETATIVEQVARALEDAHGQGILHRDIKPANIFLMRSGGEIFVKLLDFGIAKARGLELSMKTETGAALGTPLYMSPEQLFAHPLLDARVDLWALAVVAYECLTGVVPFHGETLAALGVRLHGGAFTPPSGFGRLRSPALDAFFVRAFARDQGARFGSSRELADALRAAVLTLGPLAAGPVPRLSSPSPSLSAIALTGPTQLVTTSSAPTRRSRPDGGDPRTSRARAAPLLAGFIVAILLGSVGLTVAARRTGIGSSSAAATTVTLPPSTAPLAEPLPCASVPAEAVPTVDPVAPAPPGSAPATPRQAVTSGHAQGAPQNGPRPPVDGRTKKRDHGF